MENTILCHNTNCKHNSCRGCQVAIIEIGTDGRCMDFEEIDIYKEVEGFSRDVEDYNYTY